jgi:hypothetical protein
MAKKTYQTKNEEIQQSYDDFQSEGFDADLTREISVLRCMMDQAFAANDRAAVSELANAIARLNLDQYKIAIRAEQIWTRKQAEDFVDALVGIVARNIKQFPGWEAVSQQISRDVIAELGNVKSSPSQKKELIRICDGRPGSKTGYVG